MFSAESRTFGGEYFFWDENQFWVRYQIYLRY